MEASESVSDPLAMRPSETRCRAANEAGVKERKREGKKEGRKAGRKEGRKGALRLTDGRRTLAIRWRSGRERCLVAIEILHSSVRVPVRPSVRPLHGRRD